MNIVVLPIVLPLFSAILSLMVSQRKYKNSILFISSILQFLVSLFFIYITFQGERLGLLLGGWRVPLGITLVVDLLTAIMLALSSFTLVISHLYSFGEWKTTPWHPLRLVLLHFLAVGIHLSFLTADFFNLFVAFEVMLLASYGLLTLEAQGKNIHHGFHYVCINVVGSTLFLCLAGFAYGVWGTLNFADLSLKLHEESSRGYVVFFGVMSILIFGLKAGLFPLYYWLPKSYPILPTAVAGLFAGMLTKVGVYVLLRLCVTLLPPSSEITFFVGWLSVFTMIFGVLGALGQSTIRSILSYHIISQVGYMTLCLGMMTPLAITSCILYIVHHIVVKGSLFLIGGIASRIYETDVLSQMGGLWKDHGFLGVLFMFQAFSLAGIPPLSGFWGKYFMLLESVRLEEWIFSLAILLASFLTLMSMLKIWFGAFFDKEKKILPQKGSYRLMFLSVGIMTCVSCVIGFGIHLIYPFAQKAQEMAFSQKEYVSFVFSLSQKGGSQ